ncbi:MAG: radical SAM protein [Desulfobacter postgatei]|uniref:B12-binding domain-containing radical SAM protein n=1 Tax=Desulfobacter postgatei TaxID=2293 RepID=UPI0023F400CB|nr:radical SAM protein [Desulfobacter postgatei]MDD4273746.1 radical SAM protein [Desulfobacter postgatei]
MKVLIINVCMRPDSRVKMFPIGLGYIATAVKNAGYDFDLLDIDALRLSNEEVTTYLSGQTYDAVLMGAIVTAYKTIKELTQLVRDQQPETKIIVGNTVASSIPEHLLKNTQTDVAVMGEGDVTIIEILDALDKKKDLNSINGICFKSDDGVVRTPARKAIKDIDTLSFIDRTIFDIELYIQNSKEQVYAAFPGDRNSVRSININTARGCIANCSFCYHAFRGLPYRARTPENILEEMKLLIELYRINHFVFSDELTFFSKKQTLEFCNKIIESGLTFYWVGDCRAGLFDSDKDLKIIEKMKQAGCYGMFFSLESASNEILKAMNKNITVEMFNKQAALINKANLSVWTSLVFGYPQETPETIAQTFDVCIKNKIYPSIGYLLPQPGSVMYDYAREHKFIENEDDYLHQMGDRQDLRLNMTQMSNKEFEAAIYREAKRCNRELGLNMDESNLIKTQYYRTPKKDNI